MVESLKLAFAAPDLRRRILFTIFILIIYRAASNIPVPGVDLEAWTTFTSQQSDDQLINFLNLLSGGAVSRFSVMAMGVYPYITASIIIQLLTPIVPQLTEWSQEGESGRNRINRLTYYMTVPLALLQAIGQIRLIGFSLGPAGSDGLSIILPNFGLEGGMILPTLMTLIAMTGGTMFAIWLGELITEDGIGQGISLIIFGGIVAGIFPGIANLLSLPDQTAQIFGIVAFLIITLLTIVVIVIVHEGQRRIPVQYGRRVRGRKVYQGQSSFVPLKVNTAGMIPIIFANSILIFPPLLAGLFISEEGGLVSDIANAVASFGQQDPGELGFYLYWLFFFILVVGFTYFYTDVMVRQQNIPQTLQRQGGFIPGIRPGKRTERYIMSVVRRITFAGATFLGVIAILPGIMQFLGYILNIQGLQQSALVVSGSGMIIVVGVVIDTMRQIESQLLMRQYEGMF